MTSKNDGFLFRDRDFLTRLLLADFFLTQPVGHLLELRRLRDLLREAFLLTLRRLREAFLLTLRCLRDVFRFALRRLRDVLREALRLREDLRDFLISISFNSCVDIFIIT